MGFNTTVVIFNDALGFIEEDEAFGNRLARGVRAVCGARGPQRIGAGRGPYGSADAALVVETHHADEIVSVAVGGNSGEVIRDNDGYPLLNHFCYACGKPHEGHEKKYCEICGKAAQERKTLYLALELIEGILRNSPDEKAQQARDYAIEALTVAPLGERMHVFDWQSIHKGKMTVKEAYEQLEKKNRKKS